MPSISFLNRYNKVEVDSLKALKVLQEKSEFSTDLILMEDEMYLQKAAQYQARAYDGANEEGNLYKGIVAFMVVGLKQSIPYVVQAISEVTFNGQWLCDKIASNIENPVNAGFRVRGFVADNQSSNVNVFTSLKDLLIPNQSYFLSIHLTMTSERTCFFILLRTSEIIY